MNKYEGSIIILIALIGAMFWYKLWVEPHDEYRGKIIACMNSDEVSINLPSRSKAAYVECAQRLREQR